jgi:hypothetical protein
VADWRLIVGAVLIALAAIAIPLTLRRSGRLLRVGERVEGSIVRVYEARANPYPPYYPEPARVEVRYRHGGKTRTATLWLARTEPADYSQGQRITLMVGRGLFPPRIRTAAEANLIPAYLIPDHVPVHPRCRHIHRRPPALTPISAQPIRRHPPPRGMPASGGSRPRSRRR